MLHGVPCVNGDSELYIEKEVKEVATVVRTSIWRKYVLLMLLAPMNSTPW